MKLLRAVASIFLFTVCWAYLISCKDDDDPAVNDAEKPSVNVILPVESSFVYGDATIKVKATDNLKVDNIKVYIDNSSSPIIESTSDSLNYSWDTKTVSDGNHTLRIVVSDNTGNLVEKRMAVTVRNVLVSFYLPSNSFSGRENWIFVSDDEGKVLSTQQLKLNEIYKLNAVEDFDDQTITINFLEYIYQESGEDIIYIKTFSRLPLGDYRYPNLSTVSNSSYGVTDMVFKDATNEKYLNNLQFTLQYPDHFSNATFYEDEGLRCSFSITRDASAIFVEDTSLNKYLYREVKPNKTYNAEISDFVDFAYTTMSVPTGGTVNLYVAGINTYGTFNYYEQTNASIEKGRIKAPYTKGIFNALGTDVILFTDDVNYGYYFEGNSIPSSMKMIDASHAFKITDNVINVTTSGIFDYVTFGSSLRDIDNDVWCSWTIQAGNMKEGEKTKIVVPELPKVIKDKYKIKPFADMNVSSNSYLYDFADLNGYSEYIKARLQSTTILDVKEYTWAVVKKQADGGRVSSPDRKLEALMQKSF